jgi:hypothetical protein
VIWTQILTDPTVPIDRATLRMVVDDQRTWTRRWLYPVARLMSLAAVAVIRVVKALVPFRAHGTMDRLCVWFLRRFVSPRAGTLLIRHFLVETNLLTFLLRNAGVRASEVRLRPTTLRDLGNRAVLEHDRNVYDALVAIGVAGPVRPPSRVDFSMLQVEPIDADEGRRRWLRLDIQTALCLMNIPFALCLTRDEYEAAVHSLRLDDSILALLADLTGDDTFLRWRSGSTSVRMDSAVDVPRAVYEHAVVCELAHAHLVRLAQTRGLDPGRRLLRPAGAPRPERASR